jgi:DNA modification methylase
MKTLPDKSVDLFICDLPYGETNCSWDTRIDLVEFWSQFKRLRKSKRVACIHFCSTGFGYTLIKSWEKGFKMDMVWKKRNKTGALQSRHRPMRNHEMVYFFYEQAPKYNRDKYHKRIKSVPMSVSAHYVKLPEQDDAQRTIYGETKADPGWWAHNSFKGNENPSSVLEEQDDRLNPITEKSVYGIHLDNIQFSRYDAYGHAHKPPNPSSVLEEQEKGTLGNNDVWGTPKWKAGGHCGRLYEDGTYKQPYVIPNPASVLEEDNSLDLYDECEEGAPMTLYESTKCFFGKRNHQTEKPQDILDFFLKYWTDEGDVVLDPTMGSGSTGVACKKIGRKFIGCELDAKYYDVCKKRIGETTPAALPPTDQPCSPPSCS